MFDSPADRILSAWQTFLNTSLDEAIKPTDREETERKILSLFRSVVANVPAYSSFLLDKAINSDNIASLADFSSLPLTTKGNYLSSYPLSQLCWDGKLENCDFIAVSSGTTGKPSFWPRFLTDEFSIALRFEQVFRDSFQSGQKRTLAVVCFPLGTWVGGMFTASCCRHLAAKGYPLTVITPGNNKTEILRVVGELGANFEQVVLLGYPPFLKEVIDTGISQGLDWSGYRVKLVMAGEVFSEEWRNLVANRVGCENPCYDTASLYGTADAGVLGNETPLSITIRRFLAANPDISRHLFGESRLPTLVQYDPNSRFFETIDKTLLFSGDNGVPLLRYHIADNGGIITYEEMLQFLQSKGFNPLKNLKAETKIRQLPFVYVFGRSRFVVSYFGANIYPENVALALEQPVISDWVTGKFVMEIREDTDKNSFFTVAVELAMGVESDEEKKQAIANSIKAFLLGLNSEFANYVPINYQLPLVTLLPLGDPEYFPIGVKHRYSR
jgi:phenylacetate-CoA ligase